MRVMNNPFLVIRFIFFALLTTFTFLTVVFTSWNINSFLSLQLSVPASSIFLLLSSLISLCCLALASLERFNKNGGIALVQVECGWILLLSIFDIGSAVSVTVNDYMLVCTNNLEWRLCVSTAVLVPVAWLRSVISITYFLTIFIVGVAHQHKHRNIWKSSIYSINWFRKDGSLSLGDDELCLYYLDDKVPVKKAEVAPWAESTKIRRGIDNPFKVPDLESTTTSRNSNERLPALPPKLPTVGISESVPFGSRFIEKFRESRTLSRSEDPLHYGMHFMESSSPFPHTVQNHDLPIPLPRLSEWIRADSLKGMNVHTMGPCSP